MVELASQNLACEGLLPRADLACGDACSLPHQDSSLDADFMCFTLELFDTPEIPKVLAEHMRVLRLGGRVVVAGLIKKDIRGIAVKAFEWTHRHFPSFVDCRPIFVKRSVEQAGFHVSKAIRM